MTLIKEIIFLDFFMEIIFIYEVDEDEEKRMETSKKKLGILIVHSLIQ